MKKFFKITAVSVMALSTIIACGCGKEKQKAEKYYPKEIKNDGNISIPNPHPEFLPPTKSNSEQKVIFLKIDFPFEYGEWLMAIHHPHKKTNDDKNNQSAQPQNKDNSKNNPIPQTTKNNN